MIKTEASTPHLCELFGIDAENEPEAYKKGLADYVANNRDTIEAQYWAAYDKQCQLGSVAVEALTD